MGYIDPTTQIIDSEIDLDVSLYLNSRIKNSYIGKKSIVGDFTRVNNSRLLFNNKIDRNVFITECLIDRYSYIGNTSMIFNTSIGKFCSISWRVSIGAANHDYEYITTHDFLYNKAYDINPGVVTYDRFAKKNKIGNDVWIGNNVTINNGINIGHGAVIGANSIVTKDIPPYAIVVGNPGKILKFRFEQKVIQELMELQWWDFPDEVINKNIHLFMDKNIHLNIKEFKKIKDEYINNIGR